MYCQNHPEKKLLVTTADDFKKYPDSGCEELCQAVLACGHVCVRYCHFMDRDHEAYLCDFDCDRRCPQGHECKLRCHEDCSHCSVEVEKVIPTCKHIQTMACGKVPKSSDCTSPCERTIPTCGHTCQRRCGEECGRCLETVSRPSLDCGHLQECPCWQKVPICLRPCETVLQCGHLCQGTCHSCHMGRLHARCDLGCGKTLVCGHICKGCCSDPCYPCRSQCDEGCWHRKCEDLCMNRCGPCAEPCLWRCPHFCCKMPCQEPCDRGVCNKRCSGPLLCGACGRNFLCYGLCGERCRTTCRDCDPEIEEGLCYVTLWTCGHAVEVTFMDAHVQDGKDKPQVRCLSCPRCQIRLNVRSTFRYMNEFRRSSDVVKRVQGLHKDELMSFQYSGFRSTLDECQDDIQEFLESFDHPNYLFSWERGDFLHDAYFRGSDQNRHIFAYRYQTSLALLRKLVTLKRSINSSSDVRTVKDLISWLDPNIRKFDKAEMEAFNTEYGRIYDRVKKFDHLRYIPPSLRQSNTIGPTCNSIQEKQFYRKDAIWFQCQKGHLFQLGRERDLPTCCQIILDSDNRSRDL